MEQPQPDYQTVLETNQRRHCMESQLVLDAVGIASNVVHQHGSWLLIVRGEDLETAAAELDDYRRENHDRPNRQTKVIPVYAGAATGVVLYAIVILLIAIMNTRWDLMAIGQMQAGQVMAGQWWRTITALTLHLDAGHIIANLAFGAVFGLLAGQSLGGGVAWLAIVIGGALGNFINALVQPAAHTSIGASTAVFAALGVIVSCSLRWWKAEPERRLKRWSPLIGGVLLLAYTGVGGERTDVAAHVTGFLAGLLIGWLGCRFPHRWLADSKLQSWAGVAAIVIVILAWTAGLVLVRTA